jgi:predicted site-specific integrase-resolvase
MESWAHGTNPPITGLLLTIAVQRRTIAAMVNTPQGLRVVGYCRVSSAEQAESGVSLAAQRSRLAAYAQAMDLALVDVFEDAGLSAGSLRRPGLMAALDALDDGRATGLLNGRS